MGLLACSTCSSEQGDGVKRGEVGCRLGETMGPLDLHCPGIRRSPCRQWQRSQRLSGSPPTVSDQGERGK